MKYFASTAAILGAITTVTAQDASQDTYDYGSLVDSITYTDIGNTDSSMQWNQLTEWSQQCISSPQSYSGPLSPFDQEVSLHFRGPINVKQFAAYLPSGGSSSKVKSRRAEKHLKRHLHGRHNHAHAHAHEERQVGAAVTAYMDGKTVTWANVWDGSTSVDLSSTPTTSTASAPASVNTGFNNVKVADVGSDDDDDASSAASSSAASSASSSDSSSGSVPSGSWGRSAYYSAEQGTSSGLVFLNPKGDPDVSGNFSAVFGGNTLSYASADGCSPAASPQTLSDTTIPDMEEFSIFTDSECNGDCGFTRPYTVAYHGFDGPSKAFFFEFSMPLTGKSAQYELLDAPAIWVLNSHIPRTLQYPTKETTGCSCWYSGCGELDIFEILTAGNTKAATCIHGNKAGCAPGHFDRPTGDAIKVAALFYGDSVHIKLLDSSYDFPESLDENTIAQLAGQGSGNFKQLLASGSDSSSSTFCMSGKGPDASNIHA